MSKKQDFLKSEQSRDKHPDSHMVGSAADLNQQQRGKTAPKASAQDREVPRTAGKGTGRGTRGGNVGGGSSK
jgi:hypothetical protein